MLQFGLQRKLLLRNLLSQKFWRQTNVNSNNGGNEFNAAKEIQFPGYQLPDIDLLNYEAQTDRKPTDKNLLIQTQKTIIETLEHFKVNVSAGDITRANHNKI